MDIFELGLAAYGLVTGGAVMMTLRETARTDGRNLVGTAAGLVACTLWPVLCMALLVEIRLRAPEAEA